MDITSDISWPPPYTVKKHRRARRVKLRSSKKKGLEITIPQRFSLKNLPDILEKHKAWIIKKLSLLQATQDNVLPQHINFPAIHQDWQTEYSENTKRLRVIESSANRLYLMGDLANKKSVENKLLAWVKQQAKIYLPIELKKLSEQLQLTYTKINIRGQQTRWGSCNSKKSISLNYKLLFLPRELMLNVLIHELCHTVHLNHSEKFWELVAKFDQNHNAHQRQLRKANQFIPSWV